MKKSDDFGLWTKKKKKKGVTFACLYRNAAHASLTRLSMSSRKRASLFLVSMATSRTVVPTSHSLSFSWRKLEMAQQGEGGRNRGHIDVNSFAMSYIVHSMSCNIDHS